MGGDHHAYPPIPDAKIYKVENIPKLIALRERLAARGLKDPWIRNEVWRFRPDLTWQKCAKATIFRGIHYGLAIGIVLTGLEKLWEKNRTPPGSHRANGEGGHGHH